jgi:hypothetical protein
LNTDDLRQGHGGVQEWSGRESGVRWIASWEELLLLLLLLLLLQEGRKLSCELLLLLWRHRKQFR